MFGARIQCEMNDQAKGPQADLVGEEFEELAAKP